MTSVNAGHIFEAAHRDALRFPHTGQVNLKDISEGPGYRPPPGSLAAAAQAAVARHETQHAGEHTLTIDQEKLRQAALADAQRIKEARGDASGPASVDLNSIGDAEARKLMSDEHKALGYRPPPGSLASEAQSAAARHPDASSGIDTATLARAAFEDASRIVPKNPADLNVEGVGEARALMSEEHRALGYRPPHGSLAATAQSAAAKHPESSSGADPATLAQAAVQDAKKIEAERNGSPTNGTPELNLDTISAPEARALQSEEHKELGYRPPAGSAAAQAQSAVDSRADVPVTKEMAAQIQSEEHKVRGYLPESGTIASITQSMADKNVQDGGERKLGDVGL
ncbi:hypothetical protein DICSQDRAFT_172197 [Dichomitus squalens LYAD-421 SS1]|uniref:SMP domain-containing protein n=1 Tax=Dichomitus squalens (strain LYAD-421) TaxID=732165 RepID=R7SU11_DICSQ|nr:uncharacterized protein DICSQDRAFT_172197 [Dichomitus squalens LYAD-421 SS1]EJF59215.1 hypothetical protein DICSQDRAFT_172197 [Dichomitus squalens LYAD-421 SS1]